MSVEQRPSHAACTYILPAPPKSFLASNPDRPRWITEHTHSCWCSPWKLMADGSWRVWRKGRWLRPLPGEVKLRWVWVVDGDTQTITAKMARRLIAKGGE